MFRRTRKKKKIESQHKCPRCNYLLERPHALTCPRCMESLPQVHGCTGCGMCGKH